MGRAELGNMGSPIVCALAPVGELGRVAVLEGHDRCGDAHYWDKAAPELAPFTPKLELGGFLLKPPSSTPKLHPQAPPPS